MENRSFTDVKCALELLNKCEETDKIEALNLLSQVLERHDEQFELLGYDQLIFGELIKIIQFDTGESFKISLGLLEIHYFSCVGYRDKIAETLIYKVARTNDRETCQALYDKILALIDSFDDSIAKHSKQLLKLADLNESVELNPILTEILLKLESKLPKRRTD